MLRIGDVSYNIKLAPLTKHDDGLASTNPQQAHTHNG